jgi:ribose 5-phosphate isomerase B
MCWTGTGCTIAANKVPGIRAALCVDAETAKGARIWNHANVLALSLRATPEAVARAILDTWFETPVSTDDWNLRQMERIREMEEKYSGTRDAE